METEKRLIFVTSGVDILDIFSYELMTAFQTMGYETFDFKAQEGIKSVISLMEYVKKPVTAAFFFNQIGLFASVVEGKNLWKSLQIPCIDILMDHPFCYAEDFARMDPDTIILCPDKNHMLYVQRFYPCFHTTGFLSHGGIYKDTTKKRIADRSIPVMYAGGISRFNADIVMPDFSSFSFDAKRIAGEALSHLIEEPKTTTERAIEEALANHDLFFPDEVLREIIADLHYVDLYAVSYFRECAVKTLVENKIPVTLYGYGWDHCDWINDPHLTYGGRVSAFDIVHHMEDSKIVLNTLTWFKDGAHDRIFNGMLAKSAVVTDSSHYLKETFSDKDLYIFELEEIRNLPDHINELLSDEDALQSLANNGYDTAKKSHTWRSRAEELHKDLLCFL